MEEQDRPAAKRQAPPRRAAFRAFVPLTTRWSDNDVYGHMNNVVHYQLFDTAVNSWLIAEGLLDLSQGETIGLVVETGCRYHREMAFPDRVTAGIRVGRLGTSSIRYEIGLFREDEECAAADGFFVHVAVDQTTRRPVAISGTMREKLQEIAG
ncbi:thioesterase family protein [Aurantimonas sp. VKM B-3413]|uniref:acyl-CoA thioesterase n=1 Tax=Aurantimonas sp. VKM B-3413 TaxID=2779401 RepID=UPI001E5D2792|nr:thioesterase family protein [Aurantimonas sp. VKM B-3413]MCB8840702.1 acyl-CoA thioesterase [Aurantimonas sp. VKM B-3413]